MANPTNIHSPKVQQLTCAFCKKTYYRYRSLNPNSEHTFCSKKCYGQGIANGILPVNIAMSDEIKSKIKTKAIERFETESHPWLGRKHSEFSKKKMSEEQISSGRSKGANNPMNGKHHTTEAKEAMSEKHSLAFVAGTRKQYGKNGHLHGNYVSTKTKKEMTYRSSWELAAMKWLDENNDVVTYGYEVVRIPYYENDNDRAYKRWYIPDFLIMFVDSTQELWELKPAQFCDNEKTKLKQKAAEKFCLDNDIKCYRLLDKLALIWFDILPCI